MAVDSSLFVDWLCGTNDTPQAKEISQIMDIKDVL